MADSASESASNQVGLGSRVSIELLDAQGRTEPVQFVLVPDDAADIAADLISIASPLGQAVRGRFEGDVVAYEMGDVRSIRIVSVSASEQSIDHDAAKRRQAVLEEARRKSERTNADMFASSFSGKWGDYSTDEIEE